MGVEQIQAYQTGFYICLGITVIGIALAVFSFFTLHIKDAWKISFGRIRKKSIRSHKFYFSLTKNIMVIHTRETI